MKPRIFFLFLHILLALPCCLGFAASVWANEVVIGAGAAVAENILSTIEYPLLRATDLKITNIVSTPVQAWKDLDAGKVQCAAAGLSFADWVDMMKKEGYAIPDPGRYSSWVVGQDKVRVMTNTDVPVASLSKEQLVGIFSGTVKNWSEVGGPDKPVLVVLGNQMPIATPVFQKTIMGGTPFAKDAMMGTTPEDVKNRVIRNSGAVSFSAAAKIDYLVNSPDAPEISRPITLITKGAASEDVQALVNFIKKYAQRQAAE